MCDLIYPEFPKCPVCENEFEAREVELCEKCIEKINFVYEDYCSKCGKVVDENTELCVDCKSYERYFTTARTVGVYDGGLKEYIKFFKYQKRRRLAKSLAQLMIIYIERFYDPREFDLITYIPLHKSRMQERGFNQAYLLAKEIADYFNWPLLSLLMREQATVKQSKLSKLARRKNLKQQFKVINHQQINQQKILLVDDIYTTGATVNQASKVLLRAKAKEIKVITLATGKDLNLNKGIAEF
ncbi:ComF family protein [Halanaerobacter jeridensis]|uniref:ComF family protein n=1 Tax=Halanaerobacter jeridensis TaxID=706427 RepID=A0A938XTY0_9FIRM|nr:ComF family protein [Halanaerobacter jeridensis]MBM7557478.1 ComF family protein [Halanaerobacter jeridensis]